MLPPKIERGIIVSTTCLVEIAAPIEPVDRAIGVVEREGARPRGGRGALRAAHVLEQLGKRHRAEISDRAIAARLEYRFSLDEVTLKQLTLFVHSLGGGE